MCVMSMLIFLYLLLQQLMVTENLVKMETHGKVHVRAVRLTYYCITHCSSCINLVHCIFNPQRACAATVTVLVRVSVCLSVCYHHAQQAGQRAIPTGSGLHWLDFKNGDFRKSSHFVQSYGMKTKWTSQYANAHLDQILPISSTVEGRVCGSGLPKTLPTDIHVHVADLCVHCFREACSICTASIVHAIIIFMYTHQLTYAYVRPRLLVPRQGMAPRGYTPTVPRVSTLLFIHSVKGLCICLFHHHS